MDGMTAKFQGFMEFTWIHIKYEGWKGLVVNIILGKNKSQLDHYNNWLKIQTSLKTLLTDTQLLVSQILL